MQENNLVFICSPLRGDYIENQKRAKGYCREAIMAGYIPIAPHVYFTQFLDDTVESERILGIDCGIALLDKCSEIWIYTERGISDGMKTEIEHAKQKGIKLVWR